MEFRVLGPVNASQDGQELVLGGAKQRALLAILLLAPNIRVSRDRLIDGLWGEQPPPTCEHTLDGYISRLRKTLGPDRIRRSVGGYSFRLEPGELDLDMFEELTRQGQRHVADGNTRAAADAFAAALAIWRGPALADVLDEPFATLEAARLEERRLTVLEERIDSDLATGAGAELVPELEALVREHPLRERLIASLMTALYRAGRQTAALELFRVARRRLADELGIEPGPQLTRLERAILEHDPSLTATGTTSLRAAAATMATSRRYRKRAWAAAAMLGVAALVAGVAVLMLDSTPEHRQLEAASSNRLLRVDPVTGQAESALNLPGAPAAIAAAGGSLWIADTAGNAVLRVNAGTGTVSDRIPLAAQPGDIATGDGFIWVATTAGESIDRIDPTSDGITQVIHLAGGPSGLAYAFRALWVGDPTDDAILRINPTSGAVDQTLTLGIAPSAITAGNGMIWVAAYNAGAVIEVDPRANTIVASVHVGQGPAALAFASGSLWVANLLDGTVSRVDPVSVKTVETLPSGSGPVALAATGSAVWVANEFSGTVTRIDAARGTVESSTRIGGRPTALVSTERTRSSHASLWVAALPQRQGRGGTLVLLDTRRFASTDAQIENELPPAQFLGLVNDGLVAYQHTTGSQGLHLVPDLALALPQPSGDGRTLTFLLRPGIRYSTGRLVAASDFVRAMRRLFRVHSPGAGFYADVVGGKRCLARPENCRLTRGVVANDAARTVSFHLATSDPDFLFKLALGFVVPVPPGTPSGDVGTHPIPGTGPYRFATVDARRIVLVRNLRFHEWSHAAQPDGLPDRIEWRFGAKPGAEVDAVEAGRADWTGDFPTNLAQVVRDHAAEVHSNVFPTLFFLQINTTRAPFDGVRARRAINYAVDRAAVARMYGGTLANTPACQAIPPGLPGYRRYCPYTQAPQQNGKWTAPDLHRARQLVKLSRTEGDSVNVWDVSDSGTAEPIVPYLARLLRELGYHPHLRVLTSAQFQRTTPAERATAQIIPVTFGPDYPSPAELYALFIACGGAYNWHDICRPDLDRKARLAETTSVEDPARSAHQWAQLDHQLVDLAVWAPLTSQRIIDIVSRRLRNYQFSPVYHFLPAQASIR